jgi:hypothetical protein
MIADIGLVFETATNLTGSFVGRGAAATRATRPSTVCNAVTISLVADAILLQNDDFSDFRTI